MTLSTQPYKGARDFYPEDKRLQKYMFGIWRKVAERYGYEEYDAPILEPLEIYQAKTGDEIVNEQTYVFKDRGGRDVVIRPEMTPTVSRMVAGRRQELAYPLRWYSLPSLWRYERPQRGRLREHWQLNVDIFGVATTAAEFEIITVVNEMFKAFGASSEMYEIRLNNRQMMEYILNDYLGLSKTAAHGMGRLIDRVHKLDRDAFISFADELLTPDERQNGVVEKLLDLLSVKDFQDLPDKIKKQSSANEIYQMIRSLKAEGIDNVTFDITLMRGFDYYTGLVFEVFDTDPENNRSMLGGGRYDGLVGLFGVAPVPTVGFGWGDVTLDNFLKIHHLLPKLVPEVVLYVALVGDVFDKAQNPLSELRSSGLNVAVDISGRKLGDQFKTADKKGIKSVIIIGENELAHNIYTLKNLDSGEESSKSLKDIIDHFKNHVIV